MKKCFYMMNVVWSFSGLSAGGGNSKMVAPISIAEAPTPSLADSRPADVSELGFSVAPSYLNNKRQIIYVRKENNNIFPDARFTKGEYEFALLDAAKNDKHQAFMALLQLPGINVNLTDVTGETLLMLAAKHGDVDAVSLLLQKGANLNAVNPFVTPHKTAQEYAVPSLSEAFQPQIQKNKEKIVKMLENYTKTRHTNIVQALDELSLQGPTNDMAKIIASY